MEKMIAYCGIDCSTCGAFLATKADDDRKRAEVAELWSKEFNADIKPEYINCDGCLSNSGRLFAHCYECEIRKCARDRKVVNCAYCSAYPCKNLTGLLDMVPAARKVLEEIRAGL